MKGTSWAYTARPAATAHLFSVEKGGVRGQHGLGGQSGSDGAHGARRLFECAHYADRGIQDLCCSQKRGGCEKVSAGNGGCGALPGGLPGLLDGSRGNKVSPITETPPVARPRTRTWSTAALQSAVLLMKRAAVQMRIVDVPTKASGSSEN